MRNSESRGSKLADLDDKLVTLPQSTEEFNELIAKLIKRYKFKEADDFEKVAFVVAHTITRLPVDQDTISLQTLMKHVIKGNAYSVCKNIITIAERKQSLAEFEKILTLEPNNKPVMDALANLAKVQPDAKTVYDRVCPVTPAGDNVCSLVPGSKDLTPPSEQFL